MPTKYEPKMAAKCTERRSRQHLHDEAADTFHEAMANGTFPERMQGVLRAEERQVREAHDVAEDVDDEDRYEVTCHADRYGRQECGPRIKSVTALHAPVRRYMNVAYAPNTDVYKSWKPARPEQHRVCR